MGDVGLRTLEPDDAPAWDRWIQVSPMGTREHLWECRGAGNNCSLVFEQKAQWWAVLPAILNPHDPQEVISGPGLGGGLVHPNTCRGSALIQALIQAMGYYRTLGLTRLIYHPIPLIYQDFPLTDDVYACFRLQAQRLPCQWSPILDLRGDGSTPPTVGGEEEVVVHPSPLEELQPLCPQVWESLMVIQATHPEHLEWVGVWQGEQLLAGAAVGKHRQVSEVYGYGSAQPEALACLWRFCGEQARSRGARYLDFGPHRPDLRGVGSFGLGSSLREAYQLDLTQELPATLLHP